ncbi:MAG: hypothetical protein KDI88_01965 [Gammaproteobacteria bacterium]|nr:hypothetical protein [Gammaproteobacteria bacterium]
MIKKQLLESYTPLYFLAALGAGGVAVTFFIFLMFLVPHPDSPMVTFDDLWPILTDGHPVAGALIGLAMAGMLFFTALHVRLLTWNLFELRHFVVTEAYTRLRNSNGEATLMTLPLTLAMSINVLFVNAAVFIPGLWRIVEYLFPFAILGFLAVGALALRIYTRYFARVIGNGGFDFDDNNNLGQMVAVFAFAMIAVGLAAPGAMSHHAGINAIGMFGSMFFTAIAVSMGLLKLVMGFKSMLTQGIAPAAAPSLWIAIPILTLLGIALIRLRFGLWHGFGEQVSTPGLFTLTSTILSLQLVFGILGYAVMRRIDYFATYLRGDQRHPGSYALICPGVALFVFGMFFVHLGLVRNGLIAQFSPTYFALLLPLLVLQMKTLTTLLRLNARLLAAPLRPLVEVTTRV